MPDEHLLMLLNLQLVLKLLAVIYITFRVSAINIDEIRHSLLNTSCS